jgi:hypothetical protein
MKISTLLLAAGAALLLASPARAQAELITAQLAQVDSVLTTQGLTAPGEAVRGTLPASSDEEFQVQLTAGLRYLIVGVCDGGCGDLDLTLTDGAGRTVAEDKALDDLPVMAVQGLDGTFTVKVEMITCTTEQCHFGVRVFQGAEQAQQ